MVRGERYGDSSLRGKLPSGNRRLRMAAKAGWRQECLEHLTAHALHWKTLGNQGNGLADYGQMDNLLEVISTYIHQVAGMNAGNVSDMRFVAALLDRAGASTRAAQLRPGAFRVGQPDQPFYYT